MENPVEFLLLLPAKAARFYWPLSFGKSGPISIPAVVIWLVLLVVISYHAIVVYGAWILLVREKQYREGIILAECPIILLFLALVAFGAVRFSLPGFPASAIFLSIGIVTIIQSIRLNFGRYDKFTGGIPGVLLFKRFYERRSSTSCTGRLCLSPWDNVEKLRLQCHQRLEVSHGFPRTPNGLIYCSFTKIMK